MSRILPLFVFLATSTLFAKNIGKFSSKYPYNLLTFDYGIVTNDDLAYDNHGRRIGPYNPENSVSALYWQCFPVDDVEAGFKAWVGSDGMDRYDAIHTMCTIEISINLNNDPQVFADRRGHQIDFCLDFTNAWKKLTKNQKVVCISGEGGEFYQDADTKRHKLWTWNKFKTKKGCYSFFAGDCNTSGCERKLGLCRSSSP